MIRKDFEDIINKFVKESLDLSLSKAHDYATEDILANFKRVSNIAKELKIDFSYLWEYAMFMCIMKLDRLQNLLKQNKQPKNESIKDTVQDALNYLFLMLACLIESKNVSI